MAHCDVHRFADRGRPGFLLDVQADLLENISTRVVVPLLPTDLTRQIMPDLNPVFVVADEPHIMATTQIASVPRRQLGRTVTSLAEERHAITRALDLLLTGI